MYKSQVEENRSGKGPLPQDGLISQSSLKRAQKINRIEFSLSFVWIPIHVLTNGGLNKKNEWMVRNTKIHKGLVMEIM